MTPSHTENGVVVIAQGQGYVANPYVPPHASPRKRLKSCRQVGMLPLVPDFATCIEKK